MRAEDVIAFAESLGGVTRRRPYGAGTLVLAVKEMKSFCLLQEGSDPLHIILKCDPFEAELLRAACPAIQPGYHCNKRHWNSVYLDGSLPDAEIERMLRNAYLLAAGRRKEITPLLVEGRNVKKGQENA